MRFRLPEKRIRLRILRSIAVLLLFALFFEALFEIVSEYRGYFPADFDTAFLTGREPYFYGAYSVAFYVHIISGPIALVAGLVLILHRHVKLKRNIHRWLGRAQGMVVLLLLVPSGLIMATRAFTGPIAGFGFAALSVATGVAMAMAIVTARRRNFVSHQVWATRCFILLCSPLVLRLFSGAMIVLQTDSPLTYRLAAWLSWLLPLVFYESRLRIVQGRSSRTMSAATGTGLNSAILQEGVENAI